MKDIGYDELFGALTAKQPTPEQQKHELISKVLLRHREAFFKICSDFFVTGSYRFKCVTLTSDLDIVFPIMVRQEALELIPTLGVMEVKPSNYNCGVKFLTQENLIVNFIFLHPSEFVAWSKAAKMLEVSGILSMKQSPVARPLRHAIHQTLVAMANASLSNVVYSKNYTEFL